MISIKLPQKGRKKNFKFRSKITKRKKLPARRLVQHPARSLVQLEGWGKHFEYEYIIKLSKNLIES